MTASNVRAAAVRLPATTASPRRRAAGDSELQPRRPPRTAFFAGLNEWDQLVDLATIRTLWLDIVSGIRAEIRDHREHTTWSSAATRTRTRS